MGSARRRRERAEPAGAAVGPREDSAPEGPLRGWRAAARHSQNMGGGKNLGTTRGRAKAPYTLEESPEKLSGIRSPREKSILEQPIKNVETRTPRKKSILEQPKKWGYAPQGKKCTTTAHAQKCRGIEDTTLKWKH